LHSKDENDVVKTIDEIPENLRKELNIIKDIPDNKQSNISTSNKSNYA
jgi:transposase